MMSKIQKIETFIVNAPLKEGFYFSQKEYRERCICLVKITAENGFYGWGEGYGPAYLIEMGIKQLGPLILNCNPLENEVLWQKMYRESLDFARRGILVSAISAIDIALWDLKGKILNQSISCLLGGQMRKQIKPYATGLYFSPGKDPAKKYKEEVHQYLDQGFEAIKMKVGLGIAQDVENVKKVRSLVGREIKLMIDSNHAFNYSEALKLAHLVEPYDISWFEEPVSPEFYDQYRDLRENTTIPIAGGECEYLRFGFHQLLRKRSVDIIQPDLCACGGLTEAKRITSLATAYGVEVIPHTWGSGIGVYTSLNFIANLEVMPGRLFPPNFLMEFDQTENPLRDELVYPKIKMEDGLLNVPEGPGLGCDVDENALDKFLESSNSITK